MTTYLGKSCSFGLPRVPFVNCRQFMYLVRILNMRDGENPDDIRILLCAYMGFAAFNIVVKPFVLLSRRKYTRAHIFYQLMS